MVGEEGRTQKGAGQHASSISFLWIIQEHLNQYLCSHYITLQIMVSSSSSSEAVEAVLGIVAKGNAILAEISRLAEVLVLVYVVVVLGRNTCYCRCFTTVTVAAVLLDDSGQGQCYGEISKMENTYIVNGDDDQVIVEYNDDSSQIFRECSTPSLTSHLFLSRMSQHYSLKAKVMAPNYSLTSPTSRFTFQSFLLVFCI